VIAERQIYERIRPRVQEVYERRLRHELDRLLSQPAAPAGPS
jgi:hypothetical protein